MMIAKTLDVTSPGAASIQEKLKSTGSRWSYLYAAQPGNIDINIKYVFHTRLNGEMEFAIYEKNDDGHFVLVDFFKAYQEANPYAKQIIDNHPELKKNFDFSPNV